MKISELMDGVALNADYTGWVTNDDYVLAINTTPDKNDTAVENYEVVQIGVAGLDSQMNPITQDKTYIRAGQSTTKTGTQRAFKVTGDRYVGDEAQDYMLSHAQKYGTGNAVVTDYIYFCMLTGKGEKGKVSVIVNSDGSGNAGESSSIDIDLKKSGSIPVEYTYTSAAQAAAASETESEDENTEE